MFSHLIIGSGLTGAVTAERIANVLNEKVFVIEKRTHAGGNCYDCRTDAGINVHIYGPHIFHTDYKDVYDYLSNFTDWHMYHHKVLAFIDGKYVPIPFNLNSLHMLFPEGLAKRTEEKLISRYGYNTKVPILKLKEEQDGDLRFLSDYVYEKVFLHYTEKQWGLKPEDIDPNVTARVPVYVSRDDRYFTDRYQAVPARGYFEIFKNMLSHPNIKLMLNTDFAEVLHLDLEGRKIYFMGQEFTGNVIFTGMADELFGYRFGHLPYRSLDLRFETVRTDFFQETAVVNYPNDYDFTRITEFKHMHPAGSSETVILKEYPKSYSPGRDIPYYPVFTEENVSLYGKYQDLAQGFRNLFLVGRLAEYRYYDMDDAVKRALEVFEGRIR